MTWRMFLFLSCSQRIIRTVVYFTTCCTRDYLSHSGTLFHKPRVTDRELSICYYMFSTIQKIVAKLNPMNKADKKKA